MQTSEGAVGDVEEATALPVAASIKGVGALPCSQGRSWIVNAAAMMLSHTLDLTPFTSRVCGTRTIAGCTAPHRDHICVPKNSRPADQAAEDARSGRPCRRPQTNRIGIM